MISVEAEFSRGDLNAILAAFLALPGPLRPTHFGTGDQEVDERWPVDDKRLFSSFFEKRGAGFGLFGPNLYFSSLFNGDVSILVDCDVAGGIDQARQVLFAIAQADPLFAYACLSEERYQRNRVTTKQGVNTIESWSDATFENVFPAYTGGRRCRRR